MSVRMEHPDLPGQPITVPESAVPHHAAAGWVEAPEPEPTPRKAPTAKTTSDNDDSESEPAPEKPSRRRTSKEDEK